MEVGKVCKGTAILLLVLDCIGSFVLATVGGIGVFLGGIFGGFVFCLLIYALGEIIDQLECSNANTQRMCQLLARMASEVEKKTEFKKSYSTPSASPVQKTSDGGWVCKKCNTKNDNNTQFCKDCGTYK